jgi:uncharacterized protein YjbI with pentapeptide repeats
MKIFRIILVATVLILAGVLVYWAVNPNNSPVWTGFGAYLEKENEHGVKTLWDWLDLLIIPIVIAFFAWIFKEADKEKTTKQEREKTYENILESFINIMTKLLLENNLGGIDTTTETVAVARTRVILALSNLDRARKGQIIQFLYESGLINLNPKLKILGADLNYAILDGILLFESEIRGVYFTGASLKHANLTKGVFVGCDFTNADLSGCLVNDSDFSYTNLTNAKLKNLNLINVNLEGADLTGADLKGSKIKQSQLNGIKNKTKLKIKKTEIV